MTNFEHFWASYPRKVGKGKARIIWQKLKVDDDLFGIILGALEAQKCSRQWTKENGQFVPHPSTWLGGKRWEDEVDESGTDKPSVPAWKVRKVFADYQGVFLGAINPDEKWDAVFRRILGISLEEAWAILNDEVSKKPPTLKQQGLFS